MPYGFNSQSSDSTTSSSIVDSASSKDNTKWPLFFHAVATRASHIACKLLSRPFQPTSDQITAQAAASHVVHEVCTALHAHDLTSLQDLCNSLVLAESVYSIVDSPEKKATSFISALKLSFPPGLVTIHAAQFAKSHVEHRFLIAEGGDAMYIAFMGTKLPRDYIANATVFQEHVSLDDRDITLNNSPERMLSSLQNDIDDDSRSSRSGGVDKRKNHGTGLYGRHQNRDSGDLRVASSAHHEIPAAHRGFVKRAQSIPIDVLWNEAQKKGKRLVLCGYVLYIMYCCYYDEAMLHY